MLSGLSCKAAAICRTESLEPRGPKASGRGGAGSPVRFGVYMDSIGIKMQLDAYDFMLGSIFKNPNV